MKNTNQRRFATPTAFACLALLLLATLLTNAARADVEVDPNNTGATDVVQDPDGTATTITNPVAHPLDLGSDEIAVGNTGIGELLVSGGADVSDNGVFIAKEVGSTGTVTVDGAGSTWTSSFRFRVGRNGTGTLNITNGGSVSNTSVGYIGVNTGSTGTVTVDGSGSTWTNSDDLYAGYNGTGTLNITNGGSVSNTVGYVGKEDGSIGTVTVDGAGSTWTNSDNIYVGFNGTGTGTLNITDGGNVSSSSHSHIGYFAGSTGSVTVDGPGSAWTNDDTLWIGEAGDGTLTIQNGGAVSSTNQANIGAFSGSTGKVIVDGAGSTWTNNGSIALGYAGGSGEHHGILTIQNGGAVSSTTGLVGYGLDGVGTATVDGTGSTWTNSEYFYVGHGSDGTLLVSNGGSVSNTLNASIAVSEFSTSSATVDGTGSTWTNSDSLYIGGSTNTAGGTGTLNITNDGAVTVTNTTKLWAGGTLNLDGGTLTTGSFDNTEGGTFNWTDGTLSVGTYLGNLTQNAGILAAGNSPGTTLITGDYTLGIGGILEIEIAGTSGVAGTDFDFYDITGAANLGGTIDIRDLASYLGTVGQTFDLLTASTIDLTGFTLMASPEFSLSTIAGGNGSILRLTHGPDLYVWINSAGGNYQTAANWDVTTVPGVDSGVRFNTQDETYTIDFTADATNFSATFESGNTTLDLSGQTYTLTSPGSSMPSLVVGNSTGNAALRIANGTVNAQHVSLGENSSIGGLDLGPGGNLSSVATTVGAGGTLNLNGGTLTTGSFDNTAGGTLNFNNGEMIIDGGTFDQGAVHLVLNGGLEYAVGNPTLTLINGATTANVKNVYVGNDNLNTSSSYGNNLATLNIEAGGVVSSTRGYIGDQAGSAGKVTVAGTGSQWNNSSYLVVSNYGHGTLNIEAGGVVSSTRGYIGIESDSTGVATVTGSDSQWNNSANLSVGSSGNGTLNVEAGGVVNNTNGYIGYDSGSTGTANIDGAGSTWTNSDSLYIGGGSTAGGVGTLNIEDNGTVNVTNTLKIWGGGTVNLQSGLLTTGSLDHTGGGTLNLDGGSIVTDTFLNANGSMFNFYAGSLTVNNGLTLGGNLTLATHATLITPTATTIAANRTLTLNGGTLKTTDLSVLGAFQFDRGTLEINGGTITGLSQFTVPTNGTLRTTSGTLTVGNAAAVNGFYSNGTLEVAAGATLALADANDAVLDSASWVALGDSGTAATLMADNGLTLDFGGNITGYGTVDTPDNAATPFINNGHITGDSLAEPITLAGYVKGVGTLDNVVITGTDAPGFSPATVNRGSVIYDGTLEIELGGDSPGQFDQLNHILGAGIAELGGELDILLINGFEPSEGDQFEFLTATGGVTGMFDSVELPTLDAGLLWDLDYNTNEVLLSVIAANPADFDLDGDVDGDDLNDPTLGWQARYDTDLNGGDFLTWQREFGSGVSTLVATQAAIPEPTTALLIAMAVACCVCCHRK